VVVCVGDWQVHRVGLLRVAEVYEHNQQLRRPNVPLIATHTATRPRLWWRSPSNKS